MANLADVISQVSKPEVSHQANNPMLNTINKAVSLAQAIVGFQKEMRSSPYADTLKGLGGQFATADAKRRTQLNQEANTTRGKYLESGGSPMDLPKELWGSDPSQGFQTGTGFTPGYAGDNMSYGQKQNQSGITGMYEGKQTFPAAVQSEQLNQGQQQIQNQSRQIGVSAQNSQNDFDSAMANVGIRQTDQDRDVVTNDAIQKVMMQPNADLALQMITDVGTQWVNDGADMKAILNTIKTIWPERFSATTGSDQIDPVEVVNKAFQKK